MPTAIIYISKHGTSQKSAELLKNELQDKEITLFDLKKTKPSDISNFDKVILGCSVHAGMIPKRMIHFYEKNMEVLLQKTVGLYLCCMEKGEKREEQFNRAFPEKLRNHSSANGFFGGEFILEKMNFMEKAIVKKVAGTTESKSEFNNEALKEFAKKLI